MRPRLKVICIYSLIVPLSILFGCFVNLPLIRMSSIEATCDGKNKNQIIDDISKVLTSKDFKILIFDRDNGSIKSGYRYYTTFRTDTNTVDFYLQVSAEVQEIETNKVTIQLIPKLKIQNHKDSISYTEMELIDLDRTKRTVDLTEAEKPLYQGQEMFNGVLKSISDTSGVALKQFQWKKH